ncbi:MAG: hypothetical protein J6E31_01780, partial [Pyramidobacter sp.]|nr:hypothetical protein [Pyramidobacter sp.]
MRDVDKEVFNNPEGTFCLAPPLMEECIRTFFTLTVSDADLRRLCEAQFITNYNYSHFKTFISRLSQIEQKSQGRDATALIVAYAAELEANGKKVMQERDAWDGAPFDVTKKENHIQFFQKTLIEQGCTFDHQIFRNTANAIFSRVQNTGETISLVMSLPNFGIFKIFLKGKGMTSDMNKSLLNYTYWLKNSKGPIPSTFWVPITKKELREKFVYLHTNGVNGDVRCCWAPPTMEEYIKKFFALSVSDGALHRLCEAQFITNYTISHYKAFIARLQQIEENARGKDATAQIAAYAAELEGKSKKVLQERENRSSTPLDAATIEKLIENLMPNMLKVCSEQGWPFDPQIIKNTMNTFPSHVKTFEQFQSLMNCFDPIGYFNSFLKNNGMKYDFNKSLSNYAEWLKNCKGRVPGTK